MSSFEVAHFAVDANIQWHGYRRGYLLKGVRIRVVARGETRSMHLTNQFHDALSVPIAHPAALSPRLSPAPRAPRRLLSPPPPPHPPGKKYCYSFCDGARAAGSHLPAHRSHDAPTGPPEATRAEARASRRPCRRRHRHAPASSLRPDLTEGGEQAKPCLFPPDQQSQSTVTGSATNPDGTTGTRSTCFGGLFLLRGHVNRSQ